MPTALSILNRAAELIGYKDPDEALSGNDAANFLGVLNAMVDGWNTQRLMIVAVAQQSASVSASPVTIGTGQTFNVARPIRLETGCFTRINGQDYPLTLIDREQYDAIPNKSATGSVPQVGYFDPSLPTASLYLWPVPSAAVTLYLQMQTQLSAFANLTTDYTLAPGYEKALQYSLAEELVPGRRPPDVVVAKKAYAARRAIKVTNLQVPHMQFDANLPGLRTAL